MRDRTNFSRWLAWLVLVLPAVWAQLPYTPSADLQSHLATASASGDADPLVVAAFCVPWYEQCQSLAMELENARNSLAPWAAVFLIDCKEEPKFCESHGVASYPTIRLLQGKEEKRYRNPFKSSAIVTEIVQQALPLVSQPQSSTFDLLKSLDIPVLLLTTTTEDYDQHLEIISDIAETLRGKFLVHVTTDLTFSGESILSPPFIHIFNVRDETTPVYQSTIEKYLILKFAGKVSTPLIGRLDLPSLASHAQTGLALGLIFAEEDGERKALANELRGVALKYKEKANLATVDVKTLPFLIQPMGLDATRLPAFGLQTSNEAYAFDQGQEITAESIDKFLWEILERPEREL